MMKILPIQFRFISLFSKILSSTPGVLWYEIFKLWAKMGELLHHFYFKFYFLN